MSIVRTVITWAAYLCAVALYSPPAPAQTAKETVLYVFPTDGKTYNPLPQSGVIMSPAGDLYGATSQGGSYGAGSVYQLVRPVAGNTEWTENVLHSFSGPDGVGPNEVSWIGAAGVLLGTTVGGGEYDGGILFDLIPPVGSSGWTQHVFYSFQGASDRPLGTLLKAGQNRYGVTQSGGPEQCGSVYEVSPNIVGQSSGSVKTIYSFANCSEIGRQLLPALIADASGNLYGTAYLDGTPDGFVYELSPPAAAGDIWTETTLYEFLGGTDGADPASSVTFGPDGSLYGTTQFGGAFDAGTIFKLIPPTGGLGPWTESVLYSLDGKADGGAPISALVSDGAQGFYGSDQYGGNFDCGCGEVFHVQPAVGGGNPWTLTTLHKFAGGNDGSVPVGNLLEVGGVLYGVTAGDGALDPATVYEIVP